MKPVPRSRVVAEAVAVEGSVAVEVEVVAPAGSAIAGKRSKNAIFHGVPSWDGTPFILRMRDWNV
jgi:hypothetical protein